MLPNYNLCTDEANLYVLKQTTTAVFVYDKFTGVKKSDITLPTAAKAIAYDGTNFWILISDGSFKKLGKNFAIVTSYSKSAAIPADLVYDVEYFDILADAAYVYITYNGCTDTSGSNSKYKSCIARYNMDGTFANKVEVYSGNSDCISMTKIPNNKFWVAIRSSAFIQLNSDLSKYGSTSLGYSIYNSIVSDNDTSTLFTYASTVYGELKQQHVIPASVHTLLPEAITKTPTNTMKIQYDFPCNYVYPYFERS